MGDWVKQASECYRERPQLLRIAEALCIPREEANQTLALAFGQVRKMTGFNWVAAGLHAGTLEWPDMFSTLAADTLTLVAQGDTPSEALGKTLKPWSHAMYKQAQTRTIASGLNPDGSRWQRLSAAEPIEGREHAPGVRWLVDARFDDPEDVVERISAKQQLNELWARMTEDEQALVQAVASTDTRTAAGKILGCSPNYVSVRLTRLRQRLGV